MKPPNKSETRLTGMNETELVNIEHALAGSVAAPKAQPESEFKTVTDHKYISQVCHDEGCQYLVLSNVLRRICDEAESWHTMHDHGPDSVQCDSICALIPEMRIALRIGASPDALLRDLPRCPKCKSADISKLWAYTFCNQCQEKFDRRGAPKAGEPPQWLENAAKIIDKQVLRYDKSEIEADPIGWLVGVMTDCGAGETPAERPTTEEQARKWCDEHRRHPVIGKAVQGAQSWQPDGLATIVAYIFSLPPGAGSTKEGK